MPRLARGQKSTGYVYHVINRGNGGATVFHKDGDYRAFLDLLAIAKTKYPIKVFGFCLMPNHFHLVLQPSTPNALSPAQDYTIRYEGYTNRYTTTTTSLLPGWLPAHAQTTTFLLSYEELAQNPARDIRPRREKVTSYLGKSHALQFVRARQHIGPALSKQQIVARCAVGFHSVPTGSSRFG